MGSIMQNVQNGVDRVASAIGTQGSKKQQDMAKDTKDAMDSQYRLTTDYGVKQSNTDQWLRVVNENRTGPALLEDSAGREKIHRFDHERIPEYAPYDLVAIQDYKTEDLHLYRRVVHARGAGAFGTFTLHESAADVTNAGVLTDTSRTTPLFLRFSTVLGSSGSADTVRDVRGFAIKMYISQPRLPRFVSC